MLCAFFDVARAQGASADDKRLSTAAEVLERGFRVRTKKKPSKSSPRESALLLPPPLPPSAPGPSQHAKKQTNKKCTIPKAKESSSTTLHARFEPLPDEDDAGESPGAFPDAYTRNCGVLDPDNPQQQGEWEYVYDEADADLLEDEEEDIVDPEVADTETDGSSWAYDDTDPEPSPAAHKSSKAALAKSWEGETGCELLDKWRLRRKAEGEGGGSHSNPVYAGPELCLEEEDF